MKYPSGAIPIGGAAPQTASTNNTTYRIDSATTHYRKVSYTSTNASQLGSSSTCTESTAVPYAGSNIGLRALRWS